MIVREEDVVKHKNVKMGQVSAWHTLSFVTNAMQMVALGVPFAIDREMSLSSAVQLDGKFAPYMIIPMTHKVSNGG